MRQWALVITMLAGLCLSAKAARGEGHEHSIVVNPIGTAIGIGASVLTFPTVSLNGRYQQMTGERWALQVAPQLVYSDVVAFQHYLLGARVGGRYALSARKLAGWFAAPSAVLGVAVSRQFGEMVQSALVLGVAAEVGYAWHWSSFVLELGTGLNYSGLVAHSSDFRGESGEVPGAGLSPIINVSLGYGW